MTKDDFERKRYDKEPVFDENYHIKDLCYLGLDTELGRSSFLFRLNELGNPCFCQYIKDYPVYCMNFANMNELDKWLKNLTTVYNNFKEWMEEYEKNKARLVRILEEDWASVTHPNIVGQLATEGNWAWLSKMNCQIILDSSFSYLYSNGFTNSRC